MPVAPFPANTVSPLTPGIRVMPPGTGGGGGGGGAGGGGGVELTPPAPPPLPPPPPQAERQSARASEPVVRRSRHVMAVSRPSRRTFPWSGRHRWDRQIAQSSAPSTPAPGDR